MEKITVKAKIIMTERISSNTYGNPRYIAEYKTENDYLIGKTASDGQIGYVITNNPENEKMLTYHVTKNGNIIFDYVEEVVSND